MTEHQKKQITVCRANGMTIAATAVCVGLPVGTVKTFCNRAKENDQSMLRCTYCGALLMPSDGKREKHFCNQQCYFRWWYAQKERTRTTYEKVCAHCGKPFAVPSKKTQKYCSRNCFYAERKEGVESD